MSDEIRELRRALRECQQQRQTATRLALAFASRMMELEQALDVATRRGKPGPAAKPLPWLRAWQVYDRIVAHRPRLAAAQRIIDVCDECQMTRTDFYACRKIWQAFARDPGMQALVHAWGEPSMESARDRWLAES